jgi:two-component system alkaline phosphatase synthesis response regulator PhoP
MGHDKKKSFCPHCGRVMRIDNIPISQILEEGGLRHVAGKCVLDFKELKAFYNGKTVNLTPKAWRLLAVLIAAEGSPVSRDELLTLVFNFDSTTTRTVDTFVYVIRKSIGNHIKTVHGYGYSWCPEPPVTPRYKAKSRA